MSSGDPIKATDLSVLAQSSSGKPIVRLIQQAAQTINTTNTALSFGAGSEDIDTHGFHDTVTNNTRITPNIAGYYQVNGLYVTAATGSATLAITPGKSGAVAAPRQQIFHATTSGIKSVSTTAILTADGATDYFEMFALTAGGPTLTQAGGGFSCVFECVFLRPL